MHTLHWGRGHGAIATGCDVHYRNVMLEVLVTLFKIIYISRSGYLSSSLRQPPVRQLLDVGTGAQHDSWLW